MIVNKYSNGGGGGSGSGVLVVNSLSSSEAANAPVGSLIGQYKEEGTYWATMPIDTGDANAKRIVVIGDVDFSSARVQMYLYNNNYYIELGRSGGKWTKINKGSVNGSWTLDGVNIGSSWTGETDGSVLQMSDGNNWSVTFTKQENGDWLGEITGGSDSHYKYISNLTGNNAFKYEAIAPMEVNLYMKVSGGTVAHWQGYKDAGQAEGFEIIYDDLYDFTNFCDDKIMFSVRYQFGGDTRYAFMDAANQAIVYYSDSAKTTEITRVYLNTAVKLESHNNNSRYVWIEWKEDGVYFYNKQSYTFVENLIDFHTDGVHFSRIIDPTKATAQDLGLGTLIDSGIPGWNNEGIIVRKALNLSSVGLQFNTNASQYSSTGKITILTDGTNNGPQRIFAPTAGGTAGQILVSNGDNAAPTFQNWIKGVRITSDAYEALVQAGTTDPTTLYLIVNE